MEEEKIYQMQMSIRGRKKKKGKEKDPYFEVRILLFDSGFVEVKDIVPRGKKRRYYVYDQTSSW